MRGHPCGKLASFSRLRRKRIAISAAIANSLIANACVFAFVTQARAETTYNPTPVQRVANHGPNLSDGTTLHTQGESAMIHHCGEEKEACFTRQDTNFAESCLTRCIYRAWYRIIEVITSMISIPSNKQSNGNNTVSPLCSSLACLSHAPPLFPVPVILSWLFCCRCIPRSPAPCPPLSLRLRSKGTGSIKPRLKASPNK